MRSIKRFFFFFFYLNPLVYEVYKQNIDISSYDRSLLQQTQGKSTEVNVFNCLVNAQQYMLWLSLFLVLLCYHLLKVLFFFNKHPLKFKPTRSGTKTLCRHDCNAFKNRHCFLKYLLCVS